jgi:hypothetical protein
MRTLIRLTLPHGYNLFTAALAPAPGQQHSILFVWLGARARCFSIPLYHYGVRLFRYRTGFRAYRWRPGVSLTRDTLALTLHAGWSGWLFTIGRVFRGKSFEYRDARGDMPANQLAGFPLRPQGRVRAFRSGPVHYLILWRLGFAVAWLPGNLARTMRGFSRTGSGLAVVLGRGFGMTWLTPRGAR